MHAAPNTWWGHPKGLTFLFLTEMWEKFSFFGMRALQVYYMTKQLGYAPDKASLIFGLYGAGLYLTPIFGALLSDRWLGRRRAVVIGGGMMAIGHFMLAFEALFFPALVVIALGNGLFLPNLPAQVDQLYAADNPRRRSAFNIYYVGVNLGAFLAPLVCGTLGELYGWHYGFGAAGVGMVIGLVIYLAGTRHLPPDVIGAKAESVARNERAAAGRSTLGLLLTVAGAVVLFRTAYEQTGNTVALWADTQVDHGMLGWQMPVTWLQSLNPLLIFALTPIVLAWWRWLQARGQERSPIQKMAFGAFGTAVAYLVLAGLCQQSLASGMRVPWLGVAFFFFLITWAELYILPVGLGLFARLAPVSLGATTIAAWFLCSFGGNLLAGLVGTLASRWSPTVFFTGIAGIALLAGVILQLAARRDGDVPAVHPKPDPA